MANILIATLGDSPGVISVTVKVLKERWKIDLETVYVIYPEKGHLLDLGYNLLEDALEEFDPNLEIVPVVLEGKEDVDTPDNARFFLQHITQLLKEVGAFSQQEQHIYVSIAGGRKSMSTLTLFPCQISETVHNLLHLIDKNEDTGQENIVLITELLNFSRDRQILKLLPPIDNITLLDIPFPQIPHKKKLQGFLIHSNQNVKFIQLIEQEFLSHNIDPNWKNFFKPIFVEEPLSALYNSSQFLHDSSDQGTLIMPLGESPAIIYQTYKLLEKEGKQVQKIIVIYPEENQKIRQAIQWLQEGFQKYTPDFHAVSLEGLDEVHTKEECFAFQKKMIEVITYEQAQHPATAIWLSFSGGRKTMAIFTVLAAQATQIPHVYHTLITDPILEKELIKQGKVSKLKELTPRQRKRFLFREELEPDKFTLFTIPLILFRKSEDEVDVP